jgi:hypothetical protein
MGGKRGCFDAECRFPITRGESLDEQIFLNRGDSSLKRLAAPPEDKIGGVALSFTSIARMPCRNARLEGVGYLGGQINTCGGS